MKISPAVNSAGHRQRLEQPQPAQEAKDPLAQVQELLARGVDKKTALAQVAKANKIPKRELYNKLISEEEGINI